MPSTSCQAPAAVARHWTWKGAVPPDQFTVTTPTPATIAPLGGEAILVMRRGCVCAGQGSAAATSINGRFNKNFNGLVISLKAEPVRDKLRPIVPSELLRVDS